MLVVTGRADEAIAAARRAAELDPMSPTSGTTLAYRFYYAGRFDAALAEFDRTIVGNPAFASAWLGKSQTLRALVRPADAASALAEAERHAGGRTYMRAYRGYSLAVDGDQSGAQAILTELDTLGRTQYVSPFHYALIAAGLGDAAGVARYLGEVKADGSGWAVFVPIERELAPYRPPAATARGGSRGSR